jgi:hypothetical protein
MGALFKMAKKSLSILFLTLTAFILMSFLSGCEGALEELRLFDRS